jgi:hypothetical protein
LKEKNIAKILIDTLKDQPKIRKNPPKLSPALNLLLYACSDLFPKNIKNGEISMELLEEKLMHLEMMFNEEINNKSSTPQSVSRFMM